MNIKRIIALSVDLGTTLEFLNTTKDSDWAKESLSGPVLAGLRQKAKEELFAIGKESAIDIVPAGIKLANGDYRGTIESLIWMNT